MLFPTHWNLRWLNFVLALSLVLPSPAVIAASPGQVSLGRGVARYSSLATDTAAGVLPNQQVQELGDLRSPSYDLSNPSTNSFGQPESTHQNKDSRQPAQSSIFLPIKLKEPHESYLSDTSSTSAVTIESLPTTSALSTGSFGDVGDLIYVANRQQIARTRNFSSASPTWISITAAYTGTIYDFVLDPFDPYNQAWVVGTTGVWKTTDLDATTPTWTPVLSMQTISETLNGHDKLESVARILPSPVRPGFFLIVIDEDHQRDDFGDWTGRTFDHGATWQWSRLPAGARIEPWSPLDMADDGSGRIWFAPSNGSGFIWVNYSSDWGATWTRIKSFDTILQRPAQNLFVPDRNPGVIYMNWGISLTQSVDGGYTWVDITPPGAQASMKSRGMTGTPLLPGDFFFVGRSYRGPVYHSSDSGASFPITFTTPLTVSPGIWAENNSVVATLSATDPHLLAALSLACDLVVNGCNNNGGDDILSIDIAFSNDGGATWSNKNGNWQTVFGWWAGATGSSGANGNVFIQNPKKIEETGGMLDQMVRQLGCPLCSGYAARNHVAKPIDTLSGNYTYQKADGSIPTLGGSLSFERSYSADTRDSYTSTLGYGWTHNHVIRLSFPTDPDGTDDVTMLQAPGGSELPFIAQDDGTFTPYFGITAQMSRIMATGGITTYVVTATNQTVYTFNAAGLVTQTVSPAGHVITYTYYPTGPLQSVQSNGRALSFYYDEQDRLAKVTDPVDRSTQYGYDMNGDLTVVTDTRGLAWTYQYSGTTHLLARIIDPDGRTVERTEFDGQGRAVRQYNGGDELVVQLEYGTSNTITVTDGLNHTSVDRYGRGMWLGGSDAAGQPLTRTYDLNFKPLQVADQNGNNTQLTWDTGGSNLERIVDAAGFTTTLNYDALNNLTRTVDALGSTTRYGYSGSLLISQTDALQNTWIYTYGLNNLLVAQQDPLGRITQYAYDDFGQRTVVADALGNAVRYEYDAVGRLITTTDALGRIAVNAYDAADHLIAVTRNFTSTSSQPNYLDTYNLVAQYGYDGFGRQVLVTDTLGRVTRNGYDDAGRLISATTNYSPTLPQNHLNQFNLITQYGYDAAGNQVYVTDTLGFVTRTEYDSLNRPVTATTNYQDGLLDPVRPDEDIQRVTGYDAAGNAITQADALGHVTRTWYDRLNRPISTTTNYSPTLPQNYNGEYNLVTQYAYDEAGSTILVTDTLGLVTRNYYDLLGRVVSTTVNYSPALGINFQNQYNLITRYEYDKIGNRVVVTDPLTGTTHYAYDALNRVITTTDALSGTTVTIYDAVGNRIQTIDALGHTTVYTYDAANRLSKMQDASGNTTEYAYDALGNTRIVTDANGNPTVHAYDALNREIVTTDMLSGATVTGYDVLSRRIVITDANNHATWTEYDGLGRPVTITDALGNQTIVGYDALGNRAVVTDANGNVTRYAYDALSRLITTTDALTGTTVFGYDALGRRTVMTDANGFATRTGFDALGRPVTTTDALGHRMVTGYDVLGNRVSAADDLGHTTVYTYDLLSRPVAQADPLGNVTRYGYDALGNRVVMTDANRIATRYGYDAVSRLVTVTENYSTTGLSDDQTNLVTQYGYDAVGNRAVITNARGHTTTYAYDALNRVTAMADPLGHTTRYGYDAVGNRTVMTDANTAVITYLYDAANRLIGTRYPDSSVTYAYDKVGNRTVMTDSLGATRYAYDGLYRLANVVDPFSQPVTYTYDAVGNRTTLMYPDGKVVTYTYDSANRLTTVTDWSGQATAYIYDSANRLITTTLPNGVHTAYTYDNANRLTRLTHTRDNGIVLLGDYQFVLDAVGNRIVVTETLRPPDTGGGAAAPELGLLPGTTADEVVLSVTGHRAPGLSALAALTDTLPTPSAPVVSDPVITPTQEATPMPVVAATPTPLPTPNSTPLATPSAGADNALTPVTDTTWLDTVVEGIRKAEYHITWQDKTYLPDLPGAYQAPNRAHDLRTYFTTTGIRVIPRDVKDEGGGLKDETSSLIPQPSSLWEWGLSLTGYGYAENIRPAPAAAVSTAENRIDYQHGLLTEWYINDERGLEQGFTLTEPPQGTRHSQSPLILELALSGNLTPIVTDGGAAIEFAASTGARVLRYSDLRARDASGQALPAKMELTAAGIRLVVDDAAAVYPVTIDPLLTSPGWTGESDQDYAFFGRTLSTAGDVNGDGYSDVILGADWYDNGENNEGRAYVFLGSATGLSTTAAWTAESNQADTYFGHLVSTAGDVNGDGYSDVIVGAHFYDNGETDEGRVFAWYGSSSGLGENGTPLNADWTVEGNQASAYFGGAVSTAGDVNGDGYSDVIVGADNYDNGQADEGRVFVYLGSSSGLSTTSAWTAEGDQAGANFGITLGAAGDVNGDGYADVIVGAWLYDNGENNEGRAYVYLGSSSGLSATASWTAESNQAGAEFAGSVGTAGDVNGDGYSDVIVGARYYDNGQTDEGTAYVYYGSATGLSATANWTAESNQASAYFGHAVGAAGDVNGDGYADVIVGASFYDNGESNEGRAFVYHGSATGLSATANWTAESNQVDAYLFVAGTAGDVNGDGYSDVLVAAERYDGGQTDEGRAWLYHGSAAGLSTASSWSAESDQASAHFGWSVSTAGDVNGDGYADVIVGARYYDNGQNDEGRAFAYLGSATGLSTTAAWTAESNVANAQFGYAVSTAGDVNGDGFSDVVIGAYGYANGQGGEGAAYAYYGSATGLVTTTSWMTESNRGNTNFGGAVGSAGDVNGDGYSDVIVGAPAYDNGQNDEGAVYVYYGSATGLMTITSWITESNQAGANFGYSVDTSGDVNGDGYSDIIIGSKFYDNGQNDEGRAWVYLGSASGLSTTAAWTAESDQASAQFGHSVSTAGDINGDGYSDVIVGAIKYDGGNTDEGRVFVYQGSASGLSTTSNWTGESNQNYADFGYAVDTAGDVNGDGYADILVGAQAYDNGQTDEGAAFVWHGSSSGLGASGTPTNTAWFTDANQNSASFGWSVSTAGDVNGDGYADVLVGAYRYDNGQSDEGRAYVYYGNGGDGLDVLPRQMRADGSVHIAPLGKSDSGVKMQLRLTGRTPLGRDKVKLQWQVAPLGAPFTATNIFSGTSAAWTDVLTTGVVLTQNITSLSVDTAYHWRARLLYRPGNRLGQAASRWIHIPWNGWTETDFRTPYEPVAAHFSGSPTSGAVPLTVTFVNTSTGASVFLWDFGDGFTSTLENPAHVYTATGFFSVSLTAYGATQDTLTRTNYIFTNDGLAQETVIRYVYDPLYRLTGATSTGDSPSRPYTFTYAYDQVGNRTAMTQTITETQVTTYTYDAANRLSVISGQSSVVWDNNGNLLNDGSATYGYDFANRLISATLGGVTTQFGYNGDGIRLRLIEAGTLTTYTQDYAAPLPVVLQAKTGTAVTQYVYSIGTRPLAEYEAVAWEYLLADPLGSVRQIANAYGDVTLLRSYEPYGSVLSSQGSAASVFGYAGEQIDATGLVFLRARYYQTLLGLFLSHDPWEGDVMWPGSMNGWNYAGANPVLFTDPGGQRIRCHYDPIFFPTCLAGHPDPLTPERWQISKQEAQRFQIPVELVAGTVATEIVFDTAFWDPLVDIYLLEVFLIHLYCPRSDDEYQGAKEWLDWYNANGGGGSGLGPGPGVANVHVKTAVEAEKWFQTHYLDQGLLDQPPDIYVRLATLATDKGNIRYTAAILRQLADLRTGKNEPHFYEPAPKSSLANLTDLDMQVIYEGFRAGTRPYEEDDEEANFQTSNDPKTYGPQIAYFLPYYREKASRGEY